MYTHTKNETWSSLHIHVKNRFLWCFYHDPMPHQTLSELPHPYIFFFFFWVVHYRTALQVQRTCLHMEAIIPSHTINIYINHFLSSTFLQHIFFTHLKIFYLVFPISLRLKYSSWDFFLIRFYFLYKYFGLFVWKFVRFMSNLTYF